MVLSSQPLTFVAGQILFYSLVGMLALVIPTQIARRRAGIGGVIRYYTMIQHERDKIIHKAPAGRLVLLFEHVAFFFYCAMLSGLIGMIIGD